MALSLSEFRTLYPEFDGAPDAIVQGCLDYAEARTPVDIWGDLEPEGHGLLAAHLICMRPEGRDMRLEGGLETIYSKQRAHLNRVVASGFRVTGD